MTRIDAIVLAAGRGERMGGDKHLVRVAGTALLEHVLRALQGVDLGRIVTVLRPDDAAGAKLVDELGLQHVPAEDPLEGRAASIRAGVRAAAIDTALLFAMADQPFLEAADYARLTTIFAKSKNRIVYASYAGRRGTPVLFAARYRDALLGLRGREGGRQLIERHPGDCLGIELDPDRGRDLDRPEDLPANLR